MPSLQLLQLTEHGRSLLASRRKTLLLATGIIVAGGSAAAYMQSRKSLTNQSSIDQYDGPIGDVELNTSVGMSENNVKKSRQKKGGLRSLKVLAAILLSRMSSLGTRDLLALIVTVVLRTAVSNRLAKVQGFLFRAAFLRRVPLFFRLIFENILLCFLQSALHSTSKYITGTLSLRFRKILTRLIHAQYFQDMVYYKLSHVDGRITNPEQRIASDVPKFCSELSDLIQEDLVAVADGLLYTWRLCSYASPKYLFWILALGTLAISSRRLNRLSGYADRIHELMVISRELGAHDVSTLQTNGGPNGSGKSSLFRVLGGLWPLVSGHIAKPGIGSELNKEIFYVPQRPYTAIGTLRDQIIYPLTSDQEVEPLTHSGMVELLKNVDLEYLLDRYPPEKEVNWGDELSLGEQQRLGMARLFYHKPKFAILDECTSAVTTDMENRFCAKVRAMGTSCITISHRPALVAFHDLVLSLDGEGGWTVHHKRADSPSLNEHEFNNKKHVEFGRKKLSDAERQSDAMTVQRAFANTKQDMTFSSSQDESYFSELLAASPPADDNSKFPVFPQLKSVPRKLPVRVAAMCKILVPTMLDKQGVQLLSVALLVLSRTWISDRIASLNGTTVKYVLEQDKVAFIRLIGVSVLQSAASSFIAPSLRNLTSLLALGWRIRLTKHLLKNYLRKNAYYKVFNMSRVNIDADQRLTQDLDKLTTDLSSLVTGMVKPTVDILWFTWRMKLLTGQRGVAILYAYMFLGLGFLRCVTPEFGDLASHEQQLEGTFRFMHERLRTHAESVAFFGGGAREKEMVESRFKELLHHSALLLKKKWLFGIIDEFITKQLPHNVTWGLSLLYAVEHKGNRALTSTQGELAHALRFLASVVSQSFLAFGDILELHRKFVELSGGINRIFELEELLDAAQNDEPAGVPASPSSSEDVISFSGMNIITPAQQLLARKLTCDIMPGKSLLVTGPNGSGKSSIFRVLRGLWPVVSGNLVRPGQQLNSGFGCGVFYVPQRPYTCLGTLRDQIIYPLSREEAKRRALALILDDQEATGSQIILDSYLKTILERVKLLYLLEREGGWDTNQNWEDILSLGEQQRLGMARLFFHKPRFGILDECTNATSVDVEEHLYRLAKDSGITVVTSSQRPALIPFHSLELRLIDGEGKWELRSIEQ
nr:ABC transporter D family member 1 [Ipomoea batatas]